MHLTYGPNLSIPVSLVSLLSTSDYRLSDLTVKDFLPQETADLVSFTGEILNGKTKFLD